MRHHRVRSAENIDSNPAPHLFVEIREDSWLEVTELPTHEQIEEYTANDQIYLTYHSRAFDIGIVKNWIELEPIIRN